ncbi:MAG: alpha/beta hydrolase [Deltaproteobacteria bacterium]|nr:MAG: alpha/beta hydrolase [Deltaproteobacteria bacterium]
MYRRSLCLKFTVLSSWLVSFILFMAILAGCGSNKPYRLNLMPAPDIFDAGGWQPFSDTSPMREDGTIEILFVTDREPADERDREQFYRNKRGYLLRLGKGAVELGKGEFTWEEMRRISLLKNRTEKLPLQVIGEEEYGILPTTLSEFDPPELRAQITEEPAKRFASIINAKLARSKSKDIYVYVHGFKVSFENPLIVTSELWHYLGYQGVFIAFAWPSTPSVWAYASDLETAAVSARNLRLFLQYLAEETTAAEIHLVGYSAGTRLVTEALNELALINFGEDKQAIYDQLRIGHVILVGSDVDLGIFGNMFLNGILNVSRSMSIYVSTGDQALGMSRWLFARNRLGQLEKDKELETHVAELLLQLGDLHFIDVTDAEGAMTGNGHAYFRKSPWASSDILVTLMYDLNPDERGLTRTEGQPIWTFPSDYITTLKAILAENNPALSPVRE